MAADGASGSTPEELYTTTFHELRAPISSINGYVSLLLTGELGKIPPKQREPLERIRELCRSLTELISDLLALARSGARRSGAVRQSVEVGRIAHEVVGSVRGEVRRKKIRLVEKIPTEAVHFWADSSDLSQILLNLLSNAVKFTPARGKVEMAVENRSKTLLLQVSDTGVGVRPEDQPKIFQEFYHVDHPEVGAGTGTGLGLAIVKRLVTSYGGQIRVASQVGKGSCFTVELPIRSPEGVLHECLEEAWARAKESGRSVGLVLCQLSSGGKRSTRVERDRQKILEAMEEVLRSCLRQEDRVFRLEYEPALAALVTLTPDGMPVLRSRIMKGLEGSEALSKPASGSVRWRILSVLSPEDGESPTQLLEQARAELRRAWPQGVREGADGSS